MVIAKAIAVFIYKCKVIIQEDFMRIIHAEQITQNIKEMCIQANYTLSEDVSGAIKKKLNKTKHLVWENKF